MILLVLPACSAPQDDPTPPPPDDTPTVSSPTPGTTPTTPHQAYPAGLDPQDDLSGLQGLSCATGTQCAPDRDTWLGSTCCAFGDPLEIVFSDPSFVEGVDIETRDDLLVGCGGFGTFISEILSDGTLATVRPFPHEIPRCQRIAIGHQRPNLTRRIYLANHGDTLASARLIVARRDVVGNVSTMAEIVEPGVSYEGMALFDGYLWVAAHSGGVRIYELDPEGMPFFVDVVDGFDNALKIARDGSMAFVADQASIQVFDASDPAAPERTATIPTAGKPRDVVASDGRVYVALGTAGLEVFRNDAGSWVQDQLLDLDGSAQAVDVRGPHVAVAAWDHLALFERDGLERIGSAKLKAQFEQTWGVALSDRFLFGIEWFGFHTLKIHDGLVAPELASEVEIVAFDADEAATRTMWLRNRGPLNLLVGSVVPNHTAFTATPKGYRVLPGERLPVVVGFEPPAPEDMQPELAIWTNDPSPTESPLPITIWARATDLLDVGDRLTEEFAFLDPTGANDLSNLEGKVTLLAYFALF